MAEIRHRRARNDEKSRASRSHGGRGVSLRLLASLIAFALLAVAGIPVAGAATGGAAGYAPTEPPTGGEVAFSPYRSAGASWYGPGLYGRKTACGTTLRASTLGVAHRSLPCGTMVKFAYRGKILVTQVIDRGPYVRGLAWDLTQAASSALAFESAGVGQVRYAVALEYARR